MFPHHLSTDVEDNRLLKLGYGMASPLWAPFLLAAGMGAGFWMLSAWTRRSLAAELPGAAVGLRPANDGASVASPPAADAGLDPAKLDRPEQSLAHNPPPAEMPTAAPDTAPDPIVPPEHVMDHAPADSVNAPANPAVERRIEAAQPAEPTGFGGEPGGKAALLAETSAAVLGETASFGGDMRADSEAAEPSPTLEDAGDDGADLVDAAYAANFGPVVAPGAPGKGSRKRRTLPGTAPGV
jgi:hypothetical protein